MITVVWMPIGEGQAYTQTRLNLSSATEPYSGGNFTIRAPPETGWYDIQFEPRGSIINQSISNRSSVSFDFKQSAAINSDQRFRAYTEDDLLFRQYNQVIVLFGLLVLVPGWISALQFVYDLDNK